MAKYNAFSLIFFKQAEFGVIKQKLEVFLEFINPHFREWNTEMNGTRIGKTIGTNDIPFLWSIKDLDKFCAEFILKWSTEIFLRKSQNWNLFCSQINCVEKKTEINKINPDVKPEVPTHLSFLLNYLSMNLFNLEPMDSQGILAVVLQTIKECSISFTKFGKLNAKKPFLSHCYENLFVILSNCLQFICNMVNPFHSWFLYHNYNEEQKRIIELEDSFCSEYKHLSLKSGIIDFLKDILVLLKDHKIEDVNGHKYHKMLAEMRVVIFKTLGALVFKSKSAKKRMEEEGMLPSLVEVIGWPNKTFASFKVEHSPQTNELLFNVQLVALEVIREMT